MACVEGVMHGLYLLWWVQEKQLSAGVVASALAAGDLARVFLEIPTGWLADRCGYRASLIVGSLTQVAGMLCCWLGEGVVGLVAAIALVALGDAFRSGADQALLYRSCVGLGRAEDFQRLEARARAVQLTGLVGLVLIGGAIVTRRGFAAGWIVETTLCAIGAALAFAMTEPPPCAPDPDADPDSSGASSPTISAIGSPLALILPAALLGSAASVGSFLAQTGSRSDIVSNTVLVAVVSLAEAAGAACATRGPAAGPRAQLMLCAIGGVVAMAAFVPALVLPVVIVLSFFDGLAHPLRAAAIQRVAADQVRARAASIASACDMAATMIALPLAGAWRSRRRT